MDITLYETPFKYARGVKYFLALPAVLLAAAGLFLSRQGGRIVLWVFLANALLLLFIYGLVLPMRIFIHPDRLRLKFGLFSWSIRFETIEGAGAAKGLPPSRTHSVVTSYKTQVEIVRKGRAPIRLSPENREEFLDYLHRALDDWRRTKGM